MTAQEMFDQLGIHCISEGHEHTRDGWVQIDCPFCTRNAQRWRMGYNVAYGYVNCWSCGRKGLIDALMESSGLPFGKVKDVVSQVERYEGPARERVRPGGKLIPPRGVGPLLKPHRRYLEKRGFDPDEIVQLWGVGGIGPAVPLQWRIYIPIHYHGEPVSWTTRSISDSHKTRYRSATPEQEKCRLTEVLYGEDYCRHAVILVEGPLDVWAVGPGAVACLGTNPGRAILLSLSRYPVRVLCLDNETASQRRSKELMADLAVYPGATYNVTFSKGKDASRAPRKEILELRRRFL
jgi:hypothetical protein